MAYFVITSEFTVRDKSAYYYCYFQMQMHSTMYHSGKLACCVDMLDLELFCVVSFNLNENKHSM